MIESIRVIMVLPLTKIIDVTLILLHLYKHVTDVRTTIASTTQENSQGILVIKRRLPYIKIPGVRDHAVPYRIDLIL
jgi:hypothetical protein